MQTVQTHEKFERYLEIMEFLNFGRYDIIVEVNMRKGKYIILNNMMYTDQDDISPFRILAVSFPFK